jgi:hypothetical protein
VPYSCEKLLTIDARPDAVFDAAVIARQWDGWPTLPEASSPAPALSVGDEVTSSPATRTVVELERPSLLKLETVADWGETTETYSIEQGRVGTTVFKITMTSEIVDRWWPRLVMGVFTGRFGRTVADECAKVAERVQLLAEAR